MKSLIFQHLACETAGILTKLRTADGQSLHVVALEQSDQTPCFKSFNSFKSFELLEVMGGPMDVW